MKKLRLDGIGIETFKEGQNRHPFSLSVKEEAEGLFPFRPMVKNKLWHFKEPKDREGFLRNASHVSYHLSLQKVFGTPTFTFLGRSGTHFLCPVMLSLVKQNYFLLILSPSLTLLIKRKLSNHLYDLHFRIFFIFKN